MCKLGRPRPDAKDVTRWQKCVAEARAAASPHPAPGLQSQPRGGSCGAGRGARSSRPSQLGPGRTMSAEGRGPRKPLPAVQLPSAFPWGPRLCAEGTELPRAVKTCVSPEPPAAASPSKVARGRPWTQVKATQQTVGGLPSGLAGQGAGPATSLPGGRGGESVPAEKGRRCPDRGCGPGRPGAGAGRGRPTRLVRGAPGPLWLVLSWRHRIRDAGPVVGGGWLPAAGRGAELCFTARLAAVCIQCVTYVL